MKTQKNWLFRTLLFLSTVPPTTGTHTKAQSPIFTQPLNMVLQLGRGTLSPGLCPSGLALTTTLPPLLPGCKLLNKGFLQIGPGGWARRVVLPGTGS